MTSLHEMKEKGYIPNRTYTKMIIGGGLSLGKVLLTNLSDLKKLSTPSTGEKLYKRPTRRYRDFPKYQGGMKYCNSDEKYLRPTLYCNCRSHEIIALANHLGAFKKSDYEFAEAAFEWAKRNITLEMIEMDQLYDTLQRGTGTCIHINNVFVALCRCTGIKARYKMFAAIESQSMYDEVYDPMMQRWYDALGYFSLEADIEVYLDGKWIVAHAGPVPERQAAMHVPITKLGEESIGTWFDALPGTMFWTESIPYGIGLTTKALMRIAPGTIDTMNANIMNQIEKGKKVLKEKGGEEKYDEEARTKFKPKFPEVKLKKHKKIIFEE